MYQHFEVAEHEERSVSLRIAAGKKYTEATGRRETVKYTGPWAHMLALMERQTGGGGVEVSCDLERLGGGIGELRITREEYRVPDSDQSEEGEPDSGGGGEAELGSEGAPCYTSSSSLVQVSILAHPKFAAMGDLERRALKAMVDGQDEYSFLGDPTSESGARRIIDCIQSPAAQKAFSYISKGVTSYYDVSTETTARWKGRSNKYTAGTVVENAPGGFSSGPGRNFLCSGTGVEKTGMEAWCSASFRMSSAGGWDKFLYGGD